MPKTYKSKSPLFQLGNLFDNSGSEKDKVGHGGNFETVISSWKSLKEYISEVPNVDINIIKKVIPSFLEVTQPSSSNKGSKSKNFKKNVICIDLDKLEKNFNLSKQEKKEFIHIINGIKFDKNKGNNSKQNPLDNKRTNKLTLNKKKKINYISRNKSKRGKNNGLPSLTNDKKKQKKTNHKNPTLDCRECNPNITKHSPNRKQRNPTTTLTFSQERVFQTLMNLDPRSCGDNIQLLDDKQSVETINTLFRHQKNISIKNIELKYVNPTYVVQYTSNKPDSPDTEDVPLARQRTKSGVALEMAHFGTISCPIKDDDPENPRTIQWKYHKPSLYDRQDDSQPSVERRPSLQEFENGRKSVDYIPVLLQSQKVSTRHPKWPQDHILLRLDSGSDDDCVTKKPITTKTKNGSNCKKFKVFLKKMFCLSGDDGDDKTGNFTVSKNINSKKDRTMHKTTVIKTNKKETRSKSKRKAKPVKTTYPVIRITESDFYRKSLREKKMESKPF